MSHDRPHKILLIDDSATMCAILRDALIKGGFGPRDGFEPVIARQFEAAIKIIEAEEPAAIVTDIFMEGMGGLAGIGLVTERWPSIPILAISGGAESVTGVSALATARRLDISAYMEKPFDMDVFVGAVRAMIDGTEKRQALVIDDNHLNLESLSALLHREGMDVVTTVNPRNISPLLDEVGHVDVVFLDLEFPNDDGYTILPALLADARLQNVPIVAYSVHINELQEAREAGFHGFLGKPLDASAFPNQLRRILNGESVWEVGQ